MFNKKGQESLSYFALIGLVLILIVAGAFSIFLWNLKSDTYFERSYLARDISMLEHAILASPGNVEYNYYSGKQGDNIDLTLFEFSLQKNLVKIADSDSKQVKNYASYNAYNQEGFKEVILDKPKSLFFSNDYKIMQVQARNE